MKNFLSLKLYNFAIVIEKIETYYVALTEKQADKKLKSQRESHFYNQQMVMYL